MSIYVYLKGDEVENLEGFKIKPRRDRGYEWNEYELPGIKLFREKGRWYIILHEPTEPIPVAIINIVDELSFFEYVRIFSKREAGIYCHKSAEAEVDPDVSRKDRIELHISAKKMEDLLELYHKIRIGSIRPEHSYEKEQSSAPRAFYQKLKERAESFFNRI